MRDLDLDMIRRGARRTGSSTATADPDSYHDHDPARERGDGGRIMTTLITGGTVVSADRADAPPTC